MIWVVFWLAVYLLISWWSFRTILRHEFQEWGSSWSAVVFALLGFIPYVGQINAVLAWTGDNRRHVPEWLERIGGVK